MKKVTYEEFLHILADQFPGEVGQETHLSVVCPICGTVQSEVSFTRAGVDEDTIPRAIGAGVDEDTIPRAIGFSCIGRYTGAVEDKVGEKIGRGCTYTMGGLLKLHNLVVIMKNGDEIPSFEIATPAQAQELRLLHLQDRDAITVRSRRSPDGRFFFSEK
jgi:hypothetical protein